MDSLLDDAGFGNASTDLSWYALMLELIHPVSIAEIISSCSTPFPIVDILAGKSGRIRIVPIL